MKKTIAKNWQFEVVGLVLALLLTPISCKCDRGEDDENQKKESNKLPSNHRF
jgi:hypothetical protein